MPTPSEPRFNHQTYHYHPSNTINVKTGYHGTSPRILGSILLVGRAIESSEHYSDENVDGFFCFEAKNNTARAAHEIIFEKAENYVQWCNMHNNVTFLGMIIEFTFAPVKTPGHKHTTAKVKETVVKSPNVRLEKYKNLNLPLGDVPRAKICFW